jgi:acetylornithine deacetylase/succinyl-diaminopimelate desuccinylase-like protein
MENYTVEEVQMMVFFIINVGYSGFCAVLAIKACQLQNLPHSRIIILLEADEESGSVDLPFYLEKYSHKIGTPNLIICLDSGALDYDRLWVTSSLRGCIKANIEV